MTLRSMRSWSSVPELLGQAPGLRVSPAVLSSPTSPAKGWMKDHPLEDEEWRAKTPTFSPSRGLACPFLPVVEARGSCSQRVELGTKPKNSWRLKILHHSCHSAGNKIFTSSRPLFPLPPAELQYLSLSWVFHTTPHARLSISDFQGSFSRTELTIFPRLWSLCDRSRIAAKETNSSNWSTRGSSFLLRWLHSLVVCPHPLLPLFPPRNCFNYFSFQTYKYVAKMMFRVAIDPSVSSKFKSKSHSAIPRKLRFSKPVSNQWLCIRCLKSAVSLPMQLSLDQNPDQSPGTVKEACINCLFQYYQQQKNSD